MENERQKRRYGFYRAQATGEVNEDDPNFILVRLPDGVFRYARPCFSFPMIWVPSKQWLSKYADKIEVWITYEDGLTEKPLYVGFGLKKDSGLTNEDFPNNGMILGEKFALNFDDENNKAGLFQLDGKKQAIVIDNDKTFIESDDLNLGKAAADEPALLGTTTEEKLSKIIDILLAATTNTSIGPQPFLPNTITALNNLKASLSEIKSSTVKVRK